MTERSGLDALDAGFRAEMGPPVEERNALNVPPERMPVKDLLWSVEFLRTEVERLTAELAESRRGEHCALTDYALARARADKAETELDKLGVELGTAKAVMYRALKEVEHEDVVYLIRRYLDVYPGATAVFPTTTEEASNG